MTIATERHSFAPGEDAQLCADCGEDVNTDAHAEINGASSLGELIVSPPKEGRPSAAVPRFFGAAPKRGRGRPRKVETGERAQMDLEEKPLDDPALEGMLRAWMSAKGGIEEAREDFKTVDDRLGVMVGEREMVAGTYRFGQYIVVISDVAAHQRIKVRLAKE